MVDLDGCNGSCNSLDNPSGRIWVPNKTEDVNLSVFNMITPVQVSKTLTEYMLFKCKCKFDSRKLNSD